MDISVIDKLASALKAFKTSGQRQTVTQIETPSSIQELIVEPHVSEKKYTIIRLSKFSPIRDNNPEIFANWLSSVDNYNWYIYSGSHELSRGNRWTILLG